jgi:hypothetical protein
LETYRETIHASFLKVDGLILDVDDKVAISLTDAAVAVHHFARGVFERWGYLHGIFEAVAVAGGGVGLAGGGWGPGGGHSGWMMEDVDSSGVDTVR